MAVLLRRSDFAGLPIVRQCCSSTVLTYDVTVRDNTAGRFTRRPAVLISPPRTTWNSRILMTVPDRGGVHVSLALDGRSVEAAEIAAAPLRAPFVPRNECGDKGVA